MTKKITLFVAAIIMVAFFSTATLSSAVAPKKTKEVITITNTTDFNVNEIYLSPTDDESWGGDIMDPDEVLMPGESIQVEVDCGTWDVMLVAEDGSTCTVEDVVLCDSEEWNIVADC